MIYTKERTISIIEKFANELKTDIKSISIDLNSTNAEYENDSDITIYGVRKNIQKIILSSSYNFDKSENNVIFYNSDQQKIPFYVERNETRRTIDGLYYDTLSSTFFSPDYINLMSIRANYSTSKSDLIAHLDISSRKNNYEAIYYEHLKAGSLTTQTNNLSLKVESIGARYLDELLKYIKELKEIYKDRECEIDDIINAVMLQIKIDEQLGDDFLHLTELTGIREKIKRLQR